MPESCQTKKNKSRVKVESAAGITWATQRGAMRMVERRGIAEVVLRDGAGRPAVIRIIDSDPRSYAPAKSAHGPLLGMVGKGIEKAVAWRCGRCLRVWVPDGNWGTCSSVNG